MTKERGNMDFTSSITDEFVMESRDHLEKMEENLLTLYEHRESFDRQLVDRIFRAIHSIKGAAGFLRFEKIEQLSHSMETTLSTLRSGKTLNRETVDALLQGVDLLNAMLEDLEQSGAVDISETVECLEVLCSEDSGKHEDSEVSLPGDAGFRVSMLTLKNLPPEYDYLFILEYDLEELYKKKNKSPVKLVRELLESGQIVEAKICPPSNDLFEGLPVGPLLYFVVYSTYLSPEGMEKKFDPDPDAIVEIDKYALFDKAEKTDDAPRIFLGDDDPGFGGGSNDKTDAESSAEAVPEKVEPGLATSEKDPEPVAGQYRAHQDIRIDLEKLDHLVNLVGELVIAESMVTNNPDIAGLELENFDHASRNLRRIISELQDAAMTMRMVPLSQTFRRITRLVHDVSKKVGKECRLELYGEDTELDKRVIEQIADPLLHIVRNCIDHGLESPGEREELGKPRTGTIRIEAGHRGGEVLIRISDDGRGLDREKILKRAVEKGILKNKAEEIEEKEIDKLIFEPGFTTSDTITDISGRGVGLDVVRQNMEKLKGWVEVRSRPGRGTSIGLKIPLTMAIIDGMVVRVGPANYTIPLLSIRQSFRPDPGQITVTMDGQEIVKLRDELIPVVRLHELYKIVPEQTELHRGILIDVAATGQSVCIFADEIIGHHQTVIKGMPNYVASARGVSGCTILADGEVSLILDVGRIIESVELMS